MQKVLKDKGIQKLYRYKEIKKNKNVVEFGWADAVEISVKDPIILSISESESSAASLSDYSKYFYSLVGIEPDKFVQKWKGLENDFAEYWYANKKKSEEGMATFIFNLAFLISEKKSFQHQFTNRLINFEILDVTDVTTGSTD